MGEKLKAFWIDSFNWKRLGPPGDPFFVHHTRFFDSQEPQDWGRFFGRVRFYVWRYWGERREERRREVAGERVDRSTAPPLLPLTSRKTSATRRLRNVLVLIQLKPFARLLYRFRHTSVVSLRIVLGAKKRKVLALHLFSFEKNIYIYSASKCEKKKKQAS